IEGSFFPHFPARICNNWRVPGFLPVTMNITWTYALACLGMLTATYLLTITYTSVFYHRGFTHGAITLRPWFRKFIVWSGPLLTGMDVKAWSTMHRLHHKYSDTKRDPHSP